MTALNRTGRQSDGATHEVESTDKIESAHQLRRLCYTHFLKEKAVENLTGQIDCPKLRRTTEIELSAEKKVESENAPRQVQQIVSSDAPTASEYVYKNYVYKKGPSIYINSSGR